MPDTPLTEDWLRDAGFKWHQIERQPHKHWLLWLGSAIPEDPHGTAFGCPEDFGLELSMGDATGAWWYCWARGDVSGRYSRFIHVRHIRSVEQLTRLIEALTDEPWDKAKVWYGAYHSPARAEWYRQQAERLDRRWKEDDERRRRERGEDTSEDTKFRWEANYA